MTNFISKIPLFFLFSIVCACGSDPILERAEGLKEDKKSIPQQEKEIAKNPKKPTGSPPTVAPPTVAPPKALSEESVEPPPRNPKDGPFILIEGSISIEN